MISRRKRCSLLLILIVMVVFFPLTVTIETMSIQSTVGGVTASQVDSEDVTISIAKNSTGLGQFSPLEFTLTA
jgi:hypothetical protein